MDSLTTRWVISLKVTRLVLSSGRFRSSFKCQEMASPSRSGSVARNTVSALAAAALSSLIRSSLPRTGIYWGVNVSRSTPILLLGRSRRWPMLAFTR